MDGNNSRHFSCSPGSISPHSLNTLAWRLNILAVSELCIHYKLLCHLCFQLTLILRSVCKTKAHWYQLGESEQVQTADKQTQAQQSLLFPASSLILSGPNLLSHALCQIPASRTGTGFSTQHNVLCKVTTSRLT